MTESGLSLPLPLLPGIFALGTVLAALIPAISKRWRTPADNRDNRKIGIDAVGYLLARFEEMLEEREPKITGLEKRLNAVAAKVESHLSEWNALIDWIYAAVLIVQDLGTVSRLPRPPQIVYIADHHPTRNKNRRHRHDDVLLPLQVGHRLAPGFRSAGEALTVRRRAHRL